MPWRPNRKGWAGARSYRNNVTRNKKADVSRLFCFAAESLSALLVQQEQKQLQQQEQLQPVRKQLQRQVLAQQVPVPVQQQVLVQQQERELLQACRRRSRSELTGQQPEQSISFTFPS